MVNAGESDRLLSLDDANGTKLFDIVEFSGREAISERFAFQLVLRRDKTSLPAPELAAGQSVSIRFQLVPGQSRTIYGLIRDFVRLRPDARYLRSRCTVVPIVWPATMNRSCRIFQDRTAPEILEELLRPYIAEFRFRRADYDRRNTCVQYLESDFTFAERLMEEEGIHYFFDHTRKSRLVISDESISNPTLAEPSRLRFSADRGGVEQGGRIYRIRVSQQMTVPSVRVLDQCFQRAEIPIGAAANPFPPTDGRGGQWNKEWGEYVESFGATAYRFDGFGPIGENRQQVLGDVPSAVQRTANLRAEMLAVQQSRTFAESDYLHASPGFRFELTDADPDDNGSYLLAGVEHRYQLSASATWQIGNALECLRSDQPYRPTLRTPKPTIQGMHSAIVVGPEGAVTWTDPLGRVQVRFFWEDGNEHSCWLRVAQISAGDGFGAFFTPRVGNEVLVGFLNGDPNQPVIVRSVYNARCLPAYELPAEATTTGFYSRTRTPGADRNKSSHLLFVDAPGNEQLHLHAERHAHISAEHSFVQSVGWGAGDSGELSHLSGVSRTVASNSGKDFKTTVFGGGEWKAGLLNKVKGVDWRSVWGHEIDVVLGTSSQFVVGGAMEANVGLGVALDIGFRTDLLLGVSSSICVAPHYVFNFGNRFEYTTGQRYVSTAKDLVNDVGGDYVEKIAGSRLTIVGDHVAERMHREPSGTFQYFDVGGLKVYAHGPTFGPDAQALKDAGFAIGKAMLTKNIQAMQGPALEIQLRNMPKTFAQTENPDAVIADARATIAAIEKKYGIQIVDNCYDVLISARGSGSKITLAGHEVEFIASNFNVYAEEECICEGTQASKIAKDADRMRERVKSEVHERAKSLRNSVIEAKSAAIEGASIANAAVALPGIVIAGAALVGGIKAATDYDPTDWGF